MEAVTRRPGRGSIDERAEGRNAALSAIDISKTYVTVDGSCKEALLPLTFDINDGEFVSLVGGSGSGKTTLLKICAGLVPASHGELRSHGLPGAPTPGSFGVVFQSPALLQWRTVLQNILLSAQIMHLSRRDMERRATQLLELMQLQGTEDVYPTELSGGMQQRAAIARALLHDPDMLFMDEPFGALDAMTREELNVALQAVHLQQKKTVLFVTHSISEAVFLSDRVIVLSTSPGRMLADIPIPLSRPRGFDQQSSSDFRDLEAEIRSYITGGQR